MTEQGRVGTAHPAAVVAVTIALMAVGLIMVTSASARLDHSYVDVSPWKSLFGRQALFVLAGVIVLLGTLRLAPLVLARPKARRWAVYALSVVAVGGLVLTFMPGLAHARYGSYRWVQIAPTLSGIGFQPSELAKLALVCFLASWLADRHLEVRSFRKVFVPAAASIGLGVLLVGKEDFSTAVLLAGLGAAVLFVAGCRIRHLALLGSIGACGLGFLLASAPYRIARLTAFQNIWEAPRGAGYQPLQSLTTIASGGWFGTGLGAGVQKYGYLPQSHSDFIFAVICEETGVLGGGVVIALLCAFIWLGLRTLWSARTRFERLLAFGVTACVGMQAAMNIAVVTVVTPTTGIPLPLVSAGGSGLLVFSLAIGLLAAVAARARHGGPRNEDLPESGGDTFMRFAREEGVAW